MEAFGPIIILLLSSLPIILIIIGVVFLIRFAKRTEHRADKRLTIDKNHAQFQQEQTQGMKEISQRISRIENLLKEVE
ncbi:hypothetical protein ACFSTA_03235 [Ornithinibacillus salinisoli]|uniref:DUF4083 domain-containing protein n=1 Tax=Ornithinibacillus salinisoli TaxID=1848459 RepID=A0ABW4VUZ4_9BACI